MPIRNYTLLNLTRTQTGEKIMVKEIDNNEFKLIDKIKVLKIIEKNNPSARNKSELDKAVKALYDYRTKKCND